MAEKKNKYTNVEKITLTERERKLEEAISAALGGTKRSRSARDETKPKRSRTSRTVKKAEPSLAESKAEAKSKRPAKVKNQVKAVKAPKDAKQGKKADPLAPLTLLPNVRKVQRAPRKKVKSGSEVPLFITPLGGLGEVGKNCTMYECMGDMLLVDCGTVFPDSDMYGIDLVIPDFTYVVQNADRIKGVLITHGHEDHIGALPYLLRQVNLPIYATRLTLGLIKNKLDEHGLTASAKLIEIAPRQKFTLGCFTIDPIHVNHSIPDAVGFAIECPAGIVLQTGDFKIDYTPLSGGPTDLGAISEYGKQGVLLLMSDSTNAERPGFTATEQKVADSFAKLLHMAGKRRVIIATFASNLYRIQQIIDIAVDAGRKVAVSGRSMAANTQMAMELGYLHAPEGALIDVEEINKYPPEKVALITTGSQGEPLSALSRMASSSHRNVKVGPSDFIIISATPIPGNEKMVTKVVNGLLHLGAEVIYESMYEVHVSGHACQEEQKLILSLANPKFFMPVHGEYKHLVRHAHTAKQMGLDDQHIHIGEIGEKIQITPDAIRVVDTVPSGSVMVDGLGVGDVGNVVIRDRRLLSQDGLVIVVAAVESSSGYLLSGPEIVSRGFVYVKESEELINEAQEVAMEALQKCLKDQHFDCSTAKNKIREALSGFIYKKTRRSPMIIPIISQV